MRGRAARALAALLCLGALLGAARAQVTVPETSGGNVGTPGTYDPCLDPPSGVQKGDSFVLGLAFWPGSTVADWGAPYNTTSGAPGLNPCLAAKRPNETVFDLEGKALGSYQDYLDSKGVVWGTYMVKVDTIAGLRVTRAEMDQIWKKVKRDAVAEKQAITVIAFRGQNRSEAQYVVSASAAASQGTGVVQQLSLMVAWDRGTFNGFTWYNSGPCDTCGGLSNARCVQTQYEPYVQRYPQSSCAWSLEDCDCPDALARDLLCPANNCTSVMYVGHRGSDKGGRTLNSGYQIEQINKFSITSLFWKLLDGAFNLIGNAGLGTPGTGTVQSAEQQAAAAAAAKLEGTDAGLANQQTTAGRR